MDIWKGFMSSEFWTTLCDLELIYVCDIGILNSKAPWLAMIPGRGACSLLIRWCWLGLEELPWVGHGQWLWLHLPMSVRPANYTDASVSETKSERLHLLLGMSFIRLKLLLRRWRRAPHWAQSWSCSSCKTTTTITELILTRSSFG